MLCLKEGAQQQCWYLGEDLQPTSLQQRPGKGSGGGGDMAGSTESRPWPRPPFETNSSSHPSQGNTWPRPGSLSSAGPTESQAAGDPHRAPDPSKTPPSAQETPKPSRDCPRKEAGLAVLTTAVPLARHWHRFNLLAASRGDSNGTRTNPRCARGR